jgi:hypothetical protein
MMLTDCTDLSDIIDVTSACSRDRRDLFDLDHQQLKGFFREQSLQMS